MYLLDLYLRRTFENLKGNPRMAIVSVDEHKFMGFSLQGRGKIVRADRLKGQVTRLWIKKITSRITSRIIRNLRQEKGHPRQPESLLPMPQYMIVMEVDKIIDLTPAHLK
ncbi:MAG: hypothetical protein PHT59_04330 [Candidatus Omnitrophica bacterium]|nr:hypothetical protein [Candidatus Omnitrophota bacterium]